MITTLLLCALLSTNDGAADSMLVRYDLSGVLTTFDAGMPEESMLMSAGTYEDHYRTSFENMYAAPDADSVVELLGRMFQEEFEYEGRQLYLQDDHDLLVLAPDDVQKRVRQVIEEFERTLSRTVDLQVDVLSLPADAPAPFGGRSIVDEGELGGLPTSGRPHEQYLVHLQAGRTGAVQRMRKLPLLVDYDVEIAQGAVIHDPIVGQAEAGTRVLLRGAPIEDGVALSVFLMHGGPLQEEPTAIDAPLRSFVSTDPDQDDRYIEAPRLQERYEIAFRSAAFDTVLPDGKALVISSGMQVAALAPEGGHSREVVVIRRAGGGLERMHRFPLQGTHREVVFVNTESLRAPAIEVQDLREGDGEYVADIPTLTATLRTDPSVFLVDWIDSRFSTCRKIGPWMVCVYDPSWDGSALDDLASLVGGWHDGGRVLELGVKAAAHGATVVSWSLPVRAGTRFSALAGISTTALSNYDVEVAQFAAAADPQVRPQFAGLSLDAGTADLAGGGASVDVGGVLRYRPAPPKLIALGGPLMTKLERTPFEVLRVDERASFDAGGQTRSFGDQEGLESLSVSVR